MEASLEPVFRQRFCKASDCHTLFFICSYCDRGQRYCGLICRKSCRIQQRRDAVRRHQQSFEGRLDHRDRQRAYRQRKAKSALDTAKENVTDHGSQNGVNSATMPERCEEENDRGRSGCWWGEGIALRLIVCHFCGRMGRFINPFYESG